MGGKGGGGGDYYAQPADTSGYGTPEEAAATLAATKPLDLTGMQQAIDVNKAASAATAPTPTDTGGSTDTITPGTTAADAVLTPPTYWQGRQDLQPSTNKRSSMTTTQS